MKLFTIALFCLAAPTLGAPRPQGYYRLGPQHTHTNNYRRYGGQIYERATTPYQTVRSAAPQPLKYYNYPYVPAIAAPVQKAAPESVQTPFGVFELAARNSLTRQSRNQYLPVMRALLKVMETSTPAPEDVNTLLVLTRELTKNIPEGANNVIPSFNGIDVQNMGLPEDGDVIVQYKGIPHIVTQFGAFPLSDVSLMTDAERRQFLPITRNFVNILEKDTVSQNEIDQLVEQSEELSELIPEQFRELITASINNQFDSVAPVQKAAPESVQTPFGNFELPARNSLTRQSRNQYLPVMRALLKVMETSTPAPEDVNTLLVLTRELTKNIPEGTNNLIPSFNGFNVEGMGLPEEGDVIVQYNGIPHIVTQFGAFPLSDVSLMTDAERRQFLPVTRNLINILEKNTVSQNEIDQLVEQSEELSELIPEQLRELITASITNQFDS